MIRNKGQLTVHGQSEANLAYRSLKENCGVGETNKKEEKKKDPLRERGRTGEIAQVVSAR